MWTQSAPPLSALGALLHTHRENLERGQKGDAVLKTTHASILSNVDALRDEDVDRSFAKVFFTTQSVKKEDSVSLLDLADSSAHAGFGDVAVLGECENLYRQLMTLKKERQLLLSALKTQVCLTLFEEFTSLHALGSKRRHQESADFE